MRLAKALETHDLTRDGPDAWTYRNGPQGEARCRQVVLTGGAGHVACWHALTLHGTSANLVVAKGDRIVYTATKTGSPSNISVPLMAAEFSYTGG